MNQEHRLDPAQWDEELARTDGYQLVVAGPGTGKTEFLIRRVAKLVESGKARRDEILVLTFSRRAARDISRRVEESVGGSTVPIESTTFHSLALRILESLNQGDPPTPLTTPEQVSVVKQLLATEEPEQWPAIYRGVLTSTGFAEEVADFLMRCSERLLGTSDLEARAQERADWRGIPGFYRRYLDELADRRRIDYGTLLVAAVNTLRDRSPGTAIDQYGYVLVDEYQDTSPAQAEIASLLALRHGNLTVAGDPYQSIYSFRGAELRNIDDFQKAHENTRRIVLDQSFRVPSEIMDAALKVISSGDLPGAAGPVTPASHHGRVETYIFDQETAEADWIATQIERAIHVDGTDPGAIAVLVRSKREMLNELSRSLDRRKIPHNRPDQRLVDHPAICIVADLVTLATTTAQLDDPALPARLLVEVDEAARRLLLGPLVGLSLGEQRKLRGERHRAGSWPAAISGGTNLDDIGGVLMDPTWAEEMSASDGFWHLWTSIDRITNLVNNPDRGEWRRAFSSFSQVLDRQADRDPDLSLSEFFELAEDESFEATPLISHKSTDQAVLLTTLHQAKGLEFNDVFIANAVEGVFPDLRRSRRMLRPELLSPERTTDPSAVSQFQVQEEMRLAYTAMTRARRRVVWTATDAGVDQGELRPSRFLVAASPADSLDQIGRPDLDDHEPVTVDEAEISLRRLAGDPAAPTPTRLAAVSVLARSPVNAWDATRFAGVSPPGPDKPILGSILTMSPSQADGYNQCPRRYAIERRLRIGDPTSVYMQSGSLIHTALEQAEKAIIGTGRRHNSIEAALDALKSAWETADFGTGSLNQAWLQKAQRIVIKLYETWPPDSGPPVELEKRVSLEIDGVTWYGVIDRLEQVEEGLRVVDYKTGAKPPKIDEAEVSIQLGFYAMAVNAELGEPNVVAAELWYPASKSVSLTRRKLRIDRLEEIEEAMKEVTEAISHERWEPRVSTRCQRCAFKSSCPAWPEGKGAFLP